jgi:hypothetical protein
LPLLLVASQPAFGVTIPRFERPRRILDLDRLSEQRSRSIVSSVREQVRSCGGELYRNSEQYRDCDGFIISVTKRRDAPRSIGANEVADQMKLGATLLQLV